MSVFGPFIALTDNFHFDNTPLNPVAFVQKYLRQNIQNFLFPEVKKYDGIFASWGVCG